MPKCIDPKLCYDTGTSRKFCHFSLASPLFKALHNRVFDCGTCIFCRKKRAAELAMRCVLHASLYKQNCFLTLTYDESRAGYHNDLEYSDVQGFKKRLVSYCKYHFSKRVQIFNVHEYGKNGKKHWHLVVFNHQFDDRELHTYSGEHPLYKSKRLSKLWPFGFSTIGDVTEASAMYQAQYTQKDVKNGNLGSSRAAHSKHSGIGRDYFLREYAQILSLGFVPFGASKRPVPRYFLKIADRHYSHFYEPSNFYDTRERKAKYRLFKDGEANREIADLFVRYKALKADYLEEISTKWEEEVLDSLFSKEEKDFQKSGSNFLYDLSNKNSLTEF